MSLENSHVIGEDQLLAAVVRKGPSGATLNSSYRNRDNVGSVDDLGNLIVNVSRLVPPNSGVLVFFPSYAALATGTERWKQNSIWDRICKIKQIFVEPRESGSFKMAVNAYTDEVGFSGCMSISFCVVCQCFAVYACCALSLMCDIAALTFSARSEAVFCEPTAQVWGDRRLMTASSVCVLCAVCLNRLIGKEVTEQS